MAALNAKGSPVRVGPRKVTDFDQSRLVLGLRQLLTSLESAVRESANAGHLPVVEDMLANLETTDEHFHRQIERIILHLQKSSVSSIL